MFEAILEDVLWVLQISQNMCVLTLSKLHFQTDNQTVVQEQMKPERPGPESKEPSVVHRRIPVVSLILRIVAVFGTLASALAMGRADQTLPFSTRAVLFRARYNDVPTFRFFVIANAVVCGYLMISLPVAIFHVIRTSAVKSRALLVSLDTVMLAVLTAGSSAAASVVYLAHEGNASANWLAMCQQYKHFCERITGSLFGSFAAILIFILFIPCSVYVLCEQFKKTVKKYDETES